MAVSLELCCGTKSFTKIASELGYTNNITLDNDARFAPSILIDIREWDYRRWFADRNMSTAPQKKLTNVYGYTGTRAGRSSSVSTRADFARSSRMRATPC